MEAWLSSLPMSVGMGTSLSAPLIPGLPVTTLTLFWLA
jgi:hypothetical protein